MTAVSEASRIVLRQCIRNAMRAAAPSVLCFGATIVGTGESLAGAAGPFPPIFNLSDVDGTNGFVLRGINHSDSAGYAIGAGGDINGDGYGDLVIGANGADPGGMIRAGESYIVFGRPDLGARGIVELYALNERNSTTITGIAAEDISGTTVSGAGDLNGDTFADFLIGAIFADPHGYEDAGQAYVIFGGRDVGNAGTLPLATLDGSNGFYLNGTDLRGETGSGVSRAGDINDDGYVDIIVGATWADPRGRHDAGQSYVVFGGPDVGSGGELTLTSLNGANGFMINGIGISDFSGRSVADAGDVNGDGVDDVIIGAHGADPRGVYDGGAAYVIFGHSPPFTPQLELFGLDGSNGFAVACAPLRTGCGVAVSGLGDVNDDGHDDIIIGAPLGTTNGQHAGMAYVVFGGPNVGGDGSINVLAFDGTNGFVLNGAEPYDRAGWDVNRAGDINGDGIDDIVIGATQAYSEGPGKAYVIYGRAELGAGGTMELSDVDGTNGFTIVGAATEDSAGLAVAPAGDLNGDGVADLMIGAPFADPHEKIYAGETYVVFGRAADTDGDGVVDRDDNCTQIENPDQRDTNGDGYGNVCDPDLDDDGFVNFTDLGLLKAAFFTAGPDADFDGDGKVNFVDLGIMKSFFFLPPGPNGFGLQRSANARK